MATVTLKNIKKIYPFNADEIKKNKKKSKFQLRYEELMRQQEQLNKQQR